MKQPKAYIEELGIVADVTAINYLEKEVEVYIEQNAVFDDPSLGFDFYSFDEVVFMENTGFKDRNGTDIYVGDIVKISDKYFEVTYIPFKGFVLKRENYIDGIYLSLEVNADKTSVVGNIYENKNLLED